MDTRRTELCGGSRGFTLVELLIAMTISGLVFGAIFSVYQYQQKHYTAQLDVTEMQQNIRAALNLIARDIRMAGYNPDGNDEATIIAAEPDLFYLTNDLNEDGDTDDNGEHVAYDLYESPTTKRPTLGRTSSAKKIKFIEDPADSDHWVVKPEELGDPVHQPAAENIEHLEFYYLDEDGIPTSEPADITTVVVTVVARADHPDPNFSNTQTYTFPSGATFTANDNYRRRMQSLTVQCRNAGI